MRPKRTDHSNNDERYDEGLKVSVGGESVVRSSGIAGHIPNHTGPVRDQRKRHLVGIK